MSLKKKRSLLTVPVVDRTGAVVAVIQAVNKRTTCAFTREDVSIIESLAVTAGIILVKAQLYDNAV